MVRVTVRVTIRARVGVTARLRLRLRLRFRRSVIVSLFEERIGAQQRLEV